jgi:molecular chaperone DnaK (HSP70)
LILVRLYYIIFDTLDSEDVLYNVILSQIILDKTDGVGLRIGENAYQRFIKESNSDKILYFTSFKRNLDPKKYKNLVKSDYPGDEIELNIIVQEFMRKMREEAEEKIKERKKDYKLNQIKWIITIPPLWDIKGKKIMEEAAKKVGMVNLEFILEPEAASLSIFKEDNKIIHNFIKKDKSFLIVDAGGYTVDFSANRILEDNNLEQLMIPVSIVNGSSLIFSPTFA